MTPPSWSDVAQDLAMAREQVSKAAAKHASLAGLADLPREDRELAIGKHLHDAVCAVEQALERVVGEIDGDLPRGRSYHRDLLDRAARALPDRRPPIVGPQTRQALGLLIAFRHAFRHSYGAFDYALAAPNVALAALAVPRAAEEIEAFGTAIGMREPR
ncbi:MAG: hypothetical protein K2X74_08635 [Acetobacteraceae bacterium]|nr:hypothetical protein [Acetobacteraceae bacterium]